MINWKNKINYDFLFFRQFSRETRNFGMVSDAHFVEASWHMAGWQKNMKFHIENPMKNHEKISEHVYFYFSSLSHHLKNYSMKFELGLSSLTAVINSHKINSSVLRFGMDLNNDTVNSTLDHQIE